MLSSGLLLHSNPLPTSIDAKHRANHDRFAKLSGAEFDRAYVRDMVEDHKKDVAAFTRESMSGKDSEVKTWAAKTLPTLRGAPANDRRPREGDRWRACDPLAG